MPSRITQQITTSQLAVQMQKHSLSLQRQYRNISTGIEITKPSDDISKYNMILYHNSQITHLLSMNESISTITKTLDYITSSLQDINAIISRASQIASVGIDSTSDQSTYQALGVEVDDMIHNLLDIFNRKINDDYIFGGASISIQPFIVSSYDTNGRINGINYVASSNNTYAIIDNNNIPIYYSGNSIEQTSGTSLFQTIIELRNSLSTNSPQRLSLLKTAMQNLESIHDHISSIIGSISSRLASLRSYSEQSDRLLYQHQVSKTELESTDYANAIVKMNESQYLLQSTMALMSRYFSYSILDYIV